MNLIGFNSNYPALHMAEALEFIVEGNHHWNADEVQSIIEQAMVLLNECRKRFTQYEFTKLTVLLGLASRP